MRASDPAPDTPCDPADIVGQVPDSRKLSPAFLTLVLTREPWAAAMAKPQAAIACADIDGLLDLENETVAPQLWLGESRLAQGANLNGARFERTVNLDGSTIGGSLSANSARFGGNLFLRSAAIGGAVDLIGASVAGNVELDRAAAEGALRAYGAHVGGSVFLRSGGRFRDIYLNGADIAGAVEGDGSTFAGAFEADNVRIGGSVFLRRAALAGGVVLRAAAIGSNLDADGSDLGCALDADSVEVRGNVFLRGGARFGDVSFRGAEIAKNLEADGSTFGGLLNADRVRVGGALFLRGGASFQQIILNAASMQTVQFGGSSFGGPIDMTAARVDGEFLLSSPRHGAPTWGPGATLILRNVAADALQASEAAWRRPDGGWVETDLTGFSYRRFGGLSGHEAAGMAEASPEWLVEWIAQSQPGHDERYDPQPYEQAAAALTAAGATREARALRHAQFEHKRRAHDTPWRERALLAASWAVIGHGVYPFRALWRAAALVAAGWVVAWRSAAPELAGPASKFWFSLENALPLVPLAWRHQSLDHANPYVENFFHAQKVLGFALATILVGALSLLGG